MPNALTGDFDLVVEFSPSAVDRVLAAQHQRSGPSPEDHIYFHSVVVRVPHQDEDAGPPDFGAAVDLVAPPAVVQPVDTGSAPDDLGVPDPASVIPPAILAPDVVVAVPVPPAGDEAPIHGVAAVQVSTPSITLPQDPNASRVTIHVDVRIRWMPFFDSAELPEFIHGELRISAPVERSPSAVADVVSVLLDAADVVVTFTPNPGAPLSPLHLGRVNRALDEYVRTAFEPVNLSVNLPEDGGFAVRDWSFRTLPGARPALALLLNLQAGASHTEAQRLAYTRILLRAGDDFALAVGADFLRPRLEQQIRGALIQALGSRRIIVKRFLVSDCTYRITVDQASVDFRDGRVVFQVAVRVASPGFACPDYSLQISQPFTLRVSGATVSLEPLEDPTVDLSGLFSSFLRGRVEGEVNAAAERIPSRAQPLIDGLLESLDSILAESVLRISTLRARVRAAQITRDGVTLHGDIQVNAWKPVVVISETRTVAEQFEGPPSLELNAFRSWVPGGTIQRYRWIYGAGSSPPERQIVEEHRFLTRTSFRMRQPCLWCQWCLEVRGTRDERVVVASNCTVVGGVVAELPPPATPGDYRLPLGVVDTAGRLVAHVDPWGNGDERSQRVRASSTTNLIVHFAGSNAEESLPQLRAALARRKEDRGVVFLVAVEEPSAGPRAGPTEQPGDDGIFMSWAEDYEGHWRRRFGVKETPATYLIHGDGRTAWQHVGAWDSYPLQEVLDRHLIASPVLSYQQLKLAVREGDLAPDFLFEHTPGRAVALRTLRERPILLLFWTSWSEPSLAELRRWQRLSAGPQQDVPLVLAVNDGEPAEVAHRSFEKNGFERSGRILLVPDPAREIARRYGVSCWPTTVTIDEHRLVQQISLGRTPPNGGDNTP